MTKGFTLIEVLVVMGITVVLTGFMIQNFSRTRVDLNQSRLLVQDAVREAQALALAGSVYASSGKSADQEPSSTYRCGYGVHFEGGRYLVYAGPDATTVDCSTQDRAYNAGSDDVVRTAQLSNTTVEIVLPAPDIFFEPPDPATYVCVSSPCGASMHLPGISADIHVRRKGSVCPSSDCRTIHVTTSGLITTE